ncbi:unnamed protein product [Closterium sp. Naga37s-1]|nr:unnamed protein product [Closterium sp. Naga37s-1]
MEDGDLLLYADADSTTNGDLSPLYGLAAGDGESYASGGIVDGLVSRMALVEGDDSDGAVNKIIKWSFISIPANPSSLPSLFYLNFPAHLTVILPLPTHLPPPPLLHNFPLSRSHTSFPSPTPTPSPSPAPTPSPSPAPTHSHSPAPTPSPPASPSPSPLFLSHQTCQVDAGFSVWRRGRQSIQFAAQWLGYMEDPRVSTDLPNQLGRPNHACFVDHRHDQSALGLLAKRWGLHMWPHDVVEEVISHHWNKE